MPRIRFVSSSEKDTESLGEKLGRVLRPGATVLLKGDIGAGKTCFARGLAKGLGLDASQIASPTFTLVHEHRNGVTFYHMDLYRLSCLEEAEGSGLMEYFGPDAVTVVEWPDPVEGGISGEDTVKVGIAQGASDDERIIEMDLPDGLELGAVG